MTLRPCQSAAVEHLVEFYLKAKRGDRTIVAGPTGVGKSLVELGCLVDPRLEDRLWLVTPRLEIARGILEKAGERVESEAELVEACWRRRVVTPVRLRNALREGRIERIPLLQFDEGHHATATSYVELQMLAGMPPSSLLTATPYRGTARGTAEFLRTWGEPVWMCTLRQAAELGYVSIPTTEVLPLCDDDEVELSSTGEFVATSAEARYADRLDDLVRTLKTRFVDPATGQWDRATVLAFPTRELSRRAARELGLAGCGAVHVDAETSFRDRTGAYMLMRSRAAALCQVAVLGEGVDLPVRRLVDCRPMMSPVQWQQMFGRCMRPVATGEPPPHYLCTNRNLFRHCYLMEGLLPLSSYTESLAAFGGAGRRSGYRVLGMEALGRFKGVSVRSADGLEATFYALVNVKDGRLTEYACLLDPLSPVAVWGVRRHTADAQGQRRYGTWTKCPEPEGLVGFQSSTSGPLTEKMVKFWNGSAAGRGLDVGQEVDRKRFVVLPFMLDLGFRFRCANARRS